MLFLYWEMGNYILKHQHEQGWGAKIISLLAADLKKAFPSVKGFSSWNLLYMKQFAEAYPITMLQTYNQLEEELSNGKSFTYDWNEKLQLIEKTINCNYATGCCAIRGRYFCSSAKAKTKSWLNMP
ncbi:hypothetical protein BW716_10915 [[Flexibacter] sp. ATCC 35208]|nr:hypothetical protein BW716_10915 [[Flexibacter] sp. ATCC 35208]